MATGVRRTEVLWPNEERPEWLLVVSWRIQHATPTPVGLEVRSWVTDEERRASGPHNLLPHLGEDVELPQITGQLMRDLTMRDVLARSREQLDALLLQDPDQSDWPADWRERFAEWRQETEEWRHASSTGARGRDLGDEHYREVAAVYAAAVQAGKPPTAAVAEHFVVSKSAAAKKVARARKREFLPPTTRGRVGRLTAEL